MATPTERDPLLQSSNVLKNFSDKEHEKWIKGKGSKNLGFVSFEDHEQWSSDRSVTISEQPILTRGSIYKHAIYEEKISCYERATLSVCCIPYSIITAICCCSFHYANSCGSTIRKGVNRDEAYYIDEEETKAFREREFRSIGLDYNELSQSLISYLSKDEVELREHSGHTYLPLVFPEMGTSGILFFPNKNTEQAIYYPVFHPQTGLSVEKDQMDGAVERICEEYKEES